MTLPGAVPAAPPLAGLRVGVYASGGAPWHHLALAATRGADVRVVRAEGLDMGPDSRERGLAQARQEIGALAA